MAGQTGAHEICNQGRELGSLPRRFPRQELAEDACSRCLVTSAAEVRWQRGSGDGSSPSATGEGDEGDEGGLCSSASAVGDGDEGDKGGLCSSTSAAGDGDEGDEDGLCLCDDLCSSASGKALAGPAVGSSSRRSCNSFGEDVAEENREGDGEGERSFRGKLDSSLVRTLRPVCCYRSARPGEDEPSSLLLRRASRVPTERGRARGRDGRERELDLDAEAAVGCLQPEMEEERGEGEAKERRRSRTMRERARDNEISNAVI